MIRKLDIIDKLDGEEGFVQLILKNGKIELGEPICIIYNDDENGIPTDKRILFQPYLGVHSKDYGLNDIESYISIKKEEIPNI